MSSISDHFDQRRDCFNVLHASGKEKVFIDKSQSLYNLLTTSIPPLYISKTSQIQHCNLAEVFITKKKKKNLPLPSS